MLVLLSLVAGCSGPPAERAPVTTPDPPHAFVDQDGDGWAAGPDCDDAIAAIHPDAAEACDAVVDDDCDPSTVEVYDLSSLQAVPDGGTAVLCGGELAGNVTLADRRLTLRGADSSPLVQSDPALPLLQVLGGSLILDGVHVRGPDYGYVDQVAPLHVVGGELSILGSDVRDATGVDAGLLLAEAGSLVLVDDSLWTGGYATSGGGAITVRDSDLQLVGGELFQNETGAGDGGGVRAERSTVSITGTTFHQNGATLGRGGAIYAADTELALSGVDLVASVGCDGAAAYVDGGALVAVDTRFEANVACADGGGLWIAGATASLVEVTFASNEAAGDGGAVYASAAFLDGDFVELRGNTSLGAYGGGALRATEATTVIGRGWVVADNFAAVRGGGLSLDAADFTGDAATVLERNEAALGGGATLSRGASLVAGEIRDNLADAGGGVAIDGDAEVWCALTGNVAEAGGGAWLEADSALTGEVGWGVGDAANLPDDVASAVFSADLEGTAALDCTDAGCGSP